MRRLARRVATDRAGAALHQINRLPLPPDDVASTHAAAFLIGVSGMWIADMLFEVIVRWFKTKPAD